MGLSGMSEKKKYKIIIQYKDKRFSDITYEFDSWENLKELVNSVCL